jgi:hypothetical protein
LFCSGCDRDLALDDVVIAYVRPAAQERRSSLPRFVHPWCEADAGSALDGLDRLGERCLRDVVLDELVERQRV